MQSDTTNEQPATQYKLKIFTVNDENFIVKERHIVFRFTPDVELVSVETRDIEKGTTFSDKPSSKSVTQRWLETFLMGGRKLSKSVFFDMEPHLYTERDALIVDAMKLAHKL